MPNTVKIDRVLICDDVRREDNGKAILIGVYSGDIVIKATPAKMKVCLWFLGEVAGKDISLDIELEFKAKNKENNKKYKQSIEEVNERAGKQKFDFNLIILRVPLEFNSAGVMKVKVKPKGQSAWKTILTKNVIVHSNPQ